MMSSDVLSVNVSSSLNITFSTVEPRMTYENTSFNATEIWMDSTTTANISDKVVLPTRDNWLYIYPGPSICVFGIICNIINLVVLSQPELSDSPYTFLTALAASDLGCLMTSLIHLLMSKSPNTFFKTFYDIYIFFVGSNVFFNLSVWIVVLLSVERMLFVIYPLTMKPSRLKARVSIVIVAVVIAVINIPRIFWYKITFYNDSFYPKGTPFRASRTAYRISWAHAILISFIPFVVLLITNTVLIRAVHRARVQRAKMDLRSNQEGIWRKDQFRLTITLISIIVLFFVCTFPSAFVDDPIAYALFGGSKTWAEFVRSPGNKTFQYVSNLLLFCNSSLNFPLYCAFNNKFRQAMKKVFVSCPSRKKFSFRNPVSATQSNATRVSVNAVTRSTSL